MRGTWRFVFPIVGTVVIALALLGIYANAHNEVARLRMLSTAPRATLGAPRAGPAIYVGRLYSKAPRIAPPSTPAAAYWWWVDEKKGKTTKTVCSRVERHGMELRGDGISIPLELFAANASTSLLANTRDDWTDTLVIDLGSIGYDRPTEFPREAAHCAGENRTFTLRSIPQGTAAEVTACFRDGALHACESPMKGVLSIPTASVHLERRADHAMTPVRAIGLVSLIVMIVLAVQAWGGRRRLLDTVSKSEGES